MSDMKDDYADFPFRDRMYLRFGYPVEAWLIDHFGKRKECGCTTVFGSQRLYCLDHVRWPKE